MQDLSSDGPCGPSEGGARMLRVEVKGLLHEWFNIDEMSDFIKSPSFADTLRDNISRYFGVAVENQALYDEDGLLTTAADLNRTLQRVSPLLHVYDISEMGPELREKTAEEFAKINAEVESTQRILGLLRAGNLRGAPQPSGVAVPGDATPATTPQLRSLPEASLREEVSMSNGISTASNGAHEVNVTDRFQDRESASCLRASASVPYVCADALLPVSTPAVRLREQKPPVRTHSPSPCTAVGSGKDSDPFRAVTGMARRSASQKELARWPSPRTGSKGLASDVDAPHMASRGRCLGSQSEQVRAAWPSPRTRTPGRPVGADRPGWRVANGSSQVVDVRAAAPSPFSKRTHSAPYSLPDTPVQMPPAPSWHSPADPCGVGSVGTPLGLQIPGSAKLGSAHSSTPGRYGQCPSVPMTAKFSPLDTGPFGNSVTKSEGQPLRRSRSGTGLPRNGTLPMRPLAQPVSPSHVLARNGLGSVSTSTLLNMTAPSVDGGGGDTSRSLTPAPTSRSLASARRSAAPHPGVSSTPSRMGPAPNTNSWVAAPAPTACRSQTPLAPRQNSLRYLHNRDASTPCSAGCGPRSLPGSLPAPPV